MANAGNIKIVPMNVVYGEATAQVQKITCVPDVAGSLGGKYFFIYSADNTNKNYVWFNTGSSVDPAPAGHVGIAVTITSGDSSAAVALAAKTAIDATSQYLATNSGNVITVTNAATGYAAPARDQDTTFAFEVTVQGDTALDLGFIDGNIELTPEFSELDIKAHQTGETLLGKIMTGVSGELTMTLKEVSAENLKKVFVSQGSSYVTVNAAPQEVLGMGLGKVGFNAFSASKKLVMHPKSKGTNDKTGDLTAWKAFLKLDGLTFSGTDLFMLPVTFSLFPDDAKPAAINLIAYGDVAGV